MNTEFRYVQKKVTLISNFCYTSWLTNKTAPISSGSIPSPVASHQFPSLNRQGQILHQWFSFLDARRSLKHSLLALTGHPVDQDEPGLWATFFHPVQD